MLNALKIALALVSGTIMAAQAGPYDAAIAETVDAVLVDWSRVLSCTVLDPAEHDRVLGWWETERDDLIETLEAAEVAPEITAEIAARSAPAQLMTMIRGDARALVKFCAEVDWRRQLALLQLAQPAAEVRRLLSP
jgi:hypothetical protein